MLKRFKSIHWISILSLAVVLGSQSSPTFASSSIEESAYITDPHWLQAFLRHPEYTVDHPNSRGFEVYGAKGLKNWLASHNIPHHTLNSFARPANYPSFEEFTAKLKDIHANYPELTTLTSVGKSTQGRDLWFVKISSQAAIDDLRPEVKLISSMHGDEITGREMMVQLIEDLCAGATTDPAIQELVGNTAIYIMPSMNPDGTVAQDRANATNTDLNRDFPDIHTSDNQNLLPGRAVETQAIMNFEAQRNFALSANFHGGAEVVNYPWDGIGEAFPFHNLVKNISLAYAAHVSYMSASQEFQNGVTDGFDWYLVNGGMQDWSYAYHNDLQITIELSETKWPDFAEMPSFYAQNKASLLAFLNTVHQGAGFSLKETNRGGTVHIFKNSASSQQDLGNYTFVHSRFYKVLDAGSYHMMVSDNSGHTGSFDTQVMAGKIYPHGNYTTLELR